jgi:DnaJ family protein B protein 12
MVMKVARVLFRSATFFCNLPMVREKPILAPKWPRGDLHTIGLLGTLEELLCDVGARVREDETVAIIETDKVSVDVKSPATGVIVAVLATCGEAVDERQPLYILREEAAVGSGAEGTESSEHTEAREWARRRAERLDHQQEEQERLWETQRERMRPDWQWSRQRSHRTHYTQHASGGDAQGSQRRTTQREKQQWQQWQQRQQRAHESARARTRWWEWSRGAETAGAGTSAGSVPRSSGTIPFATGTPCTESPVARVLAASGHYEVLGVPRGASSAEIKRAFNRCAMQVHPDRCDAANAQEAMVRLGLAYHALSDGTRRRAYDAGTAHGRRM